MPVPRINHQYMIQPIFKCALLTLKQIVFDFGCFKTILRECSALQIYTITFRSMSSRRTLTFKTLKTTYMYACSQSPNNQLRYLLGHICMLEKDIQIVMLALYCSDFEIRFNQRTIGPVKAHLISWPTQAQNIQNLEKYGKEMTLTFNTHIPSKTQLVVFTFSHKNLSYHLTLH